MIKRLHLSLQNF